MPKIAIIIIIAVIILAGLGWGAYWYFYQQKPVACTQDAKLCPDGSYVSRTGPNCEFVMCQGTKAEIVGSPLSQPLVLKSENEKRILEDKANNFSIEIPDGWDYAEAKYYDGRRAYLAIFKTGLYPATPEKLEKVSEGDYAVFLTIRDGFKGLGDFDLSKYGYKNELVLFGEEVLNTYDNVSNNYYFINNNKGYEFKIFKKDRYDGAAFNIIRTLRFLDKKYYDENGWQIYRNRVFGYEIKLPPDWDFDENDPFFGARSKEREIGYVEINPRGGRPSILDETNGNIFGKQCNVRLIIFVGREAIQCEDTTIDSVIHKLIRITQLEGLNSKWTKYNEISVFLKTKDKNLIQVFDKVLASFKFIE